MPDSKFDGNNGNGDGVSRRSFIKGMGSGVVTSAVLPAVSKAGDKLSSLVQDSGDGVTRANISININGLRKNVSVEARETLADVIRNKFNMTGTKIVCNQGECGGCTVLMDGKAVYSCMTLAMDAAGKEVTTIEGLSKDGKLSAVQQAFIDKDAYQCGYCTPGQIMAGEAFVKSSKDLNEKEIKTAMSGNLCRCAAYPHIVEAVADAARKERG